MSAIHIHKRVSRPIAAFFDRAHAGIELRNFMNIPSHTQSTVFALPRGGVPVAQPIAEALQAPLELAMVRKLPVPVSPEVGFGAVALDGSSVLNDRLLDHFGIHSTQIASVTEQVLQELRRRATEYLGRETPPDLTGRLVYLVDDGLATGYTMIVAAKMIRKLNPQTLILCVPVSPWDSLASVGPYFQEVYVLYVQERAPFAVASFYRQFPDLDDQEIRRTIERQRTLQA